MKTESAVMAALRKYEDLLNEANRKIRYEENWLDVADNQKDRDLYLATLKDLDTRRASLPEIEFKIRFAKWVLE